MSRIIFDIESHNNTEIKMYTPESLYRLKTSVYLNA